MRTLLGLLLALSACSAPSGGAEPPADDLRVSIPDPTRPRVTEAGLARAIHAETNRVRLDRGRRALSWHGRLERVAVAYSRDMARRGFFDHVDPDGHGPTERATAGGVTCRRSTSPTTWREGVGENLARNGLYRRYTERRSDSGTRRTYDWYTRDALARAVVEAWMDSPGHRDNLLDRGYRSEGIGVAFTPSGGVYVTQSFC
ncbi:MAG TPA: CAP domain-containing protein [Rubricoccaceae bacterium]